MPTYIVHQREAVYLHSQYVVRAPTEDEAWELYHDNDYEILRQDIGDTIECFDTENSIEPVSEPQPVPTAHGTPFTFDT